MIVKEIPYTDLLFVPFKYGGRDNNGLDCYGLVMEMYKRRGINLPEFGSESKASIIHRMILNGEKLFEKLSKPEPYCIVTFSIVKDYVSHIGVVLFDKYRFIHILEHTCVSIERLDADEWRHRIRGFYKWL